MAEGDWDKEGNEYIERILKEILPLVLSQTEEALKEVFAKARYFVSFNDLSRYIMLALEEKVRLTPRAREFIYGELKKIYEKTQKDVLKAFPVRYEFNIADERAIEYATKLHDFYLGKFFQGDREIGLRVVKWMSKYYLEQGNPIGKGQQGIKEFLEQFKQYIQPQTEWKARQIIDTSVNYLRNSARVRALQKTKITKYKWDAIGDRLTCPACRSMDGRIFETKETARVLDLIEGSEDPTIIKELRPIISKPVKAPSSSIPTKMPPAHPHCYDKETEVYTSEGWKHFKDLRGDELILSLNPENGELEWLPISKIIKWYHKGKMLLFEHEHFNLMVTNQHSMLLYSENRTPNFFFESAEWCFKNQEGYKFYLSGDTFASREETKVTEIGYDGYVYCVELPRNHTLWVRRKGHTVWSGNCRCTITAYIEEFETPLPVVLERASGVPFTPLQRELEEEYRALSKEEISNRIRAHLGAEWGRPPANAKPEDIKKFLNYAKEQFEMHGKEVGTTSLEEYKKMAYDIIRRPERVFVERNAKGETFYIFTKGDKAVISSDDNLSILSFFKKNIDELIKERVKELSSAIIQLL